MALTNAQAALIAVTTMSTHVDTNLRSSTTILDFATTFKGWLDAQDEADQQHVDELVKQAEQR